MGITCRRAAALGLMALVSILAVMAVGSAAGSGIASGQDAPAALPVTAMMPRLRLPLIMRKVGSDVGAVSGWVVDATSKLPLDGASICRAAGWPCTHSEANGRYHLPGVPAGTSNLRVTAAGYDTLFTRIDITAGETITRPLALSAPLEAGEWRFVLTWDAEPPDLDMFLWLPDETAVYWGARGDCVPEPPIPPVGVCLEQDSREGYGPETITIKEIGGSGYYTLGVHRYDDPGDAVIEPSITASRARLHVYNGDGLQLEFRIPTDGEGQFWYVLDLDASGVVTPYNAVSDHDPYAAAAAVLAAERRGLPLKAR